jgi:S1-C subfamily serine protease
MDGAYSKAVPADKIAAALASLKDGKPPPRGDLGAALRLVPAGVARRAYRLPADAVPKPTDGGTPSVIAVAALLPGAETAGGMQPGDVIASVDGVAVGDDLLAVDKAAGGKVGKSVPVVVYRNGTKVDLAKVPVRDLEALKVKKFGEREEG